MVGCPSGPAAIKRLDALFSAAMIAHEAIFEMRRELIANDRGNAEQAGLLEESAQIVTGKLPGLSGTLRGTWYPNVVPKARSSPIAGFPFRRKPAIKCGCC